MSLVRQIFAPLLLTILLASCADLIPTLDSIRVKVAIEDARVEKATNRTLFGKNYATDYQMDTELANIEHEVIRFNLTSETDLFKYFKDTQIQIRCWVKGATPGRTYEGGGVLSDYRFRDQSVPSIRRQDGLFPYTVYAFFNLIADDKEYIGGKPAGHLNLKEEKFDQIGCAMVGATMSPFRFPRTHDFVLSHKQFIDLYQELRR